MLEELAYKYALLSQAQIIAINYGFLVIGGAIGIYRSASESEIQRSPYFAMTWLVLLCVAFVSITQIFWIVPALVGG